MRSVLASALLVVAAPAWSQETGTEPEPSEEAATATEPPDDPSPADVVMPGDDGGLPPEARAPWPKPKPTPAAAEDVAAPPVAPLPDGPPPLTDLRGPHGADRPARRPPRGETWDTWGTLRGRFVATTDPVLDPEGTTAGRRLWGESRLVAGASWFPTDRITLDVEVEALNGSFAGDTTAVGTIYTGDVFRMRRDAHTDIGRLVPRQAKATFLFPEAGQLRLGVEMFTWGTGMLANDGAGDPDFGDPDTGSVVARVAFATAPWRYRPDASVAARGLSLFVSADAVLRDDTADVFRGDLAFQGVVGFRLAHPRVDVGAFAVGRWQRDRRDPYDPRPDRSTTVVFPVDVYAKVLLTPLGTTLRAILETEVVSIQGRSNRPYTEETVPDGARVQSVGALARVRLDHEPSGLTAKLEAGYASGDDDPRDDVFRTFSMHTDHQVGLILFDEVLPLVTARSLDQAADPGLVAQPSPGARYTVNQGQVSNAVYVFPVLRARPWKGLDVRLGYLAAWTAGAFVDPYESARAGGYNVSYGGIPGGGGFLGHEVDAALRYDLALPAAVWLDLGVEGGVFVPGRAFDGLGGSRLDTQWMTRVRGALRW